jgi:uncharacterized protein YdaT
MPWQSKDATRFTKKATTGILKRQFADVANSMLKAGKSEGAAIRGANSVVAKHKAKTARKK